MTLLLPCLDGVLQVISEGRAEGRIVRGVEGLTQESLAAETILPRLDVEQSILHRQESRVTPKEVRRQAAQRRVVVEHIDAPPEGADYQIALPLLDRQVANGDGRQAALETVPFLAPVDCEIEAEFGTDEQQARVHVVFRDGQYWSVRRQVALD